MTDPDTAKAKRRICRKKKKKGEGIANSSAGKGERTVAADNLL